MISSIFPAGKRVVAPDGATDDGVIEEVGRADGDEAGVHADADVQRVVATFAPVFVQKGHFLLHVLRHLHGMQGVFFVRSRCAEEDLQSVLRFITAALAAVIIWSSSLNLLTFYG